MTIHFLWELRGMTEISCSPKTKAGRISKMKKLMAFMICMAMCVAMFGCVEKKEFDSGESGSSPLASNEGVIENAPSAESSQEEAASAVTEVSKTADA